MKNDPIKTILANFDFDRVHQAMTALEWRWWNAYREPSVPTHGQLYQTAERLLRQIADPSGAYCETATGGFRARRHSDGSLELSFEVATWGTETAAAPAR